MKQHPLKTLLRHAVLAALPLASQVSCANNNPPAKPVENEPVASNTTDDPCRSKGVTRKTSQESFATQIAHLSKPLSAEECIALCKAEFEKNRVGNFNSLIKIEKISINNCRTESRPFSIMPYAGGKTSTPSTLLLCEVNYTGLDSPYTCPRPVVGRIPHGLHVDQQEAHPHAMGEYLTDMAAMETAAITAFQYLAQELMAYGAPADLITRAQAAVNEETRHAYMAGLLSASCAARLPEVRVDDFQLRSLYEIALENAIEGCVNETFAAVCGLWQSKQAKWDVFRYVIEHIAEEEMGHAALSWDIHTWIMPQLSQAEQQQIQAAQAKAVDTLLADFQQEGNPLLQRIFGLPTREDAVHLFAQLQGSIWDKRSFAV